MFDLGHSQEKHTFNSNWNLYKKYEYVCLSNWYIKSAIYKGFLYSN